jgi:hypothetical protein
MVSASVGGVSGEVAEWSNALDSKSSVRFQRTVGSNPTLSAKKRFGAVEGANCLAPASDSKGLAMFRRNRQTAAGSMSANPTLSAKKLFGAVEGAKAWLPLCILGLNSQAET